MIRSVQILALAVLALSVPVLSPGQDTQSSPPAEASISDSEIGLAKGSVFDVADPGPVIFGVAEPGESALLPRPFVGAPPRVPHSVADFVPLTRDENLCVDCHLIEEGGEGEPTPIPESHLIDLRNAPDVIGEGVTGTRYNCSLCHVPTTDAKPLFGAVAGQPRE